MQKSDDKHSPFNFHQATQPASGPGNRYGAAVEADNALESNQTRITEQKHSIKNDLLECRS